MQNMIQWKELYDHVYQFCLQASHLHFSSSWSPLLWCTDKYVIMNEACQYNGP